MAQAQGAGNPPAAARTTFQLVGGQGAANTVVVRWSVVHDSPLVTSFAFLDWDIAAPPARPSAARSELVGAILLAARHPTPHETTQLDGSSFLTTEMDPVSCSRLAHELDTVGAFDTAFSMHPVAPRLRAR